MTWLSDLGNRVGIGIGLKRSLYGEPKHHHHHHRHTSRQEKSPPLGILAFETAKTMSRLISLYKSLSDAEIMKLRKDVMRTQGVEYLNSKDEGYLLKLACQERIEDLDSAVVVVSRLGKKCVDPGLTQFEYVYADLKLGFIDLGKLDYASREVEKMIERLERYISATSHLFSGLETLTELEASERKLNQWKNHKMSSIAMAAQQNKSNTDGLEQKLSWQKQQVRHFREVSLWNQNYDKIVGLMARIVCIVYARICVIFGPYNSVLPTVPSRHARFLSEEKISEKFVELEQIISRSGPIPKASPKQELVRFWSHEAKPAPGKEKVSFGTILKEMSYGGIPKAASRLMLQASESTVGGCGLALRYANVIIVMEKYLNSPASVNDHGRKDLYLMLPENLKMAVRNKLKNVLKKENDSGWWDDDSLAQGLRDGLRVILGWLAPMAHDTVRWQSERNFEKMNFDAKPTLYLLQTLFFADREKTEAAMTEVLVGLSCICRYEMLHASGGE